MGDVTDEFYKLQAQLESIRSSDISHNSLGEANGFHEAESAKNQLVEYVQPILVDLHDKSVGVNPVIKYEAVTKIEAAIVQIETITQQLETLVTSGVHNNNFPAQRKSHITRLEQVRDTLFKDLYLLEIDLRTGKLRNSIDNDGYFEKSKKSVEEAVTRANDGVANIDKIVANLQDSATKEGVNKSSAHFGELLEHHKTYENNWLLATAASAIVILAAVAFAFHYDLTPLVEKNNLIVVLGFLKRIFLISIPAIFFRICLGKYNAERELRIVYGHREKVLDQYRNFEAGIGDDMDAKNSFRLEIAKYIFSDPRTGYSTTDRANLGSVNINPVVNTLEKIVDRK